MRVPHERNGAGRDVARRYEEVAVNRSFWRGDWVDFAGLLMVVVGSLAFFQGLIAIVRNHYYSVDPDEILAAASAPMIRTRTASPVRPSSPPFAPSRPRTSPSGSSSGTSRP